MSRRIAEKKIDFSPSYEIALGNVMSTFPRKQINRILEKHGRKSERDRRLPTFLTVFLIIMFGFFGEGKFREVLRILMERLPWFFSKENIKVPVDSAITKVRQKVGYEVLKEMHDDYVRPIATKKHKNCFFKGYRIVAVDGVELSLIDTFANREYFGKPRTSVGECASPVLRSAVLIECGTRVMFATELGGVRDSEMQLFNKLHDKLESGMILLADRYYYNYRLWLKLGKQGVKVLFRLKCNLETKILWDLPDGSHLVEILPPKDLVRSGEFNKDEKILARLIEYVVKFEDGSESEKIRLLTNFLDEQEAPADELANLFPERWNIETGFNEVKTWLKGRGKTLQSQTPELAIQEYYGYILAHYVIRKTMAIASLRNGLSPTELSFVHSIRVIKRKFQAFSPCGVYNLKQ